MEFKWYYPLILLAIVLTGLVFISLKAFFITVLVLAFIGALSALALFIYGLTGGFNDRGPIQ